MIIFPFMQPFFEVRTGNHLGIGTVRGGDHLPAVFFNESDEVLVCQVIVSHIQIAEDRHLGPGIFPPGNILKVPDNDLQGVFL